MGNIKIKDLDSSLVLHDYREIVYAPVDDNVHAETSDTDNEWEGP